MIAIKERLIREMPESCTKCRFAEKFCGKAGYVLSCRITGIYKGMEGLDMGRMDMCPLEEVKDGRHKRF